ncbi:dihydrofolate reductase family protein [Rhodohalobacter sp. SW132]|uniref:dihydrofolate reductase family protein n=1 Tax=Rhodohalobacter sp. SW132 TaxID=2293433 RepID=UPI0013156659|nr:dihydrofolate reductase family protein [Rhodohalobacter sp. SW132]
MTQIIDFPFISLDGRINDRDGKIDFHNPDDEILSFVNERHAAFSNHIYDDSTYEIMKWWENPSGPESKLEVIQKYTRIWNKTHKTVISKQLSGLDPDQYTVLPELTADALSELKQKASSDILIGGSDLTIAALNFGLLNRIDLMTVPVILGGGDSFFEKIPRTELNLLETRSFKKGWIFSSYEIK